MRKIVVNLFEHLGTSLLVKWPTGIFYTLQTAGNFCLCPEDEGFIIPIGNDVDENNRFNSKQDALWDYFKEPKIVGEGAIYGLTEKNADDLDMILRKPPSINHIEVDRTLLNKSHEGWVHVHIHKRFEGITDYCAFPQKGILIWAS